MKKVLLVVALLLAGLRGSEAQIQVISIGAAKQARGEEVSATPTVETADTSFAGFRVTGFVADMEGALLPGATVILSDRRTRKIYGAGTDREGFFSVKVPAGHYTAEASHLGYDKTVAECSVSGDIRLDTLRLKLSIQQLAEITVKADNILYNPKGYKLNVGADPRYKGYDLTDVLSTAPGLMVTDEALSTFGKGIQTVYIDERPVKFSGQSLVQYLKSRRAENIRTIEVVTESGVEEDAAAMGGAVLRITTNRLDNGGFGTVRAGVTASNTMRNFYSTASADMRAGRFSLYSHLVLPSFTDRHSRSENITENRQTGLRSSSLSTRGSIRRFSNTSAMAGIGYDFDKSNFLTLEGSYDFAKNPSAGLSRRTSTMADDAAATSLAERLRARSYNTSARATLYYVSIFGDDSRLVASAEYSRRLDRDSRRYDYTGGEDERAWCESDRNRRTAGLWGASVRYTRHVRGRYGSLAAGLKYSAVTNGNLRDVETDNQDLAQRPVQHSLFDYDERISAAFASYSDTFGRWGIVAGVRVEQTDTRTSTTARSYTTGHLGLFPNMALSYTVSRDRGHRISLDASRGIVRPGMESLNPNADYSSVDFYTVGNPLLRPSYRNSLTLRTVWFKDYSLAVSCGSTEHGAASITRLDEAGILYSSPENLASLRHISVDAAAAWTIARSVMLNLNIFYNHTRHGFGGHTYIYNTLNSYLNIFCNLPRGFRAGAGVIWSTGGGEGNTSLGATRPHVSLSLNKSLLKQRLQLSLRGSNLLSAGRSESISDEPDFYRRTRSLLAGPGINFMAAYNFKWGNRRVKVQHASAQESESQRL